MKLFLVFLAFIGATISAPTMDNPEVELPSSLKICKLNDINRDDCLKDAIQSYLPDLHLPIPSLDMPSMDPFVLPLTHFEYKRNPQVYGSLSVKNSKTYGMSLGKVNSVKTQIDDSGLEAEFDMTFSKIFLQGLYKGEVSFNDIKLSPKGSFNVTIKDINVVFKTKGKITERNNEKYMMITNFDMEPEVGEMNIKVTGLLPDEGLNKIANDLVNNYSLTIYKQMLPETKKSWEPILLGLLNKVTMQVPFRRLLINNE